MLVVMKLSSNVWSMRPKGISRGLEAGGWRLGYAFPSP
jgi:hypothetical protein